MSDGIRRMTEDELKEFTDQFRPPNTSSPYSWQVIDSAPKDGHPVDLWISYCCFGRERFKRISNAYWSRREEQWMNGSYPIEDDGVKITHWIRIGDPA